RFIDFILKKTSKRKTAQNVSGIAMNEDKNNISTIGMAQSNTHVIPYSPSVISDME
ncbi:hypothetical protein BgiBS90_029058, partial [Biomphalaria glabrata]